MISDKAFIVAEISANHGNDINIIKQSIKVARDVGCDAVKIQTYRADTITLDCDNQYFQINTGTIWDGKTLYNLYEEAYTPWEWHAELFQYAKEMGITLFSTPFDATAVDLLEECGNPIYKIASFEINDAPLLEYVASKQKPMIISTGIATKEEIEEAVNICKSLNNEEIYLLKCTSQYPARIEDANLATMVDMRKQFGVQVGLSDHTMGHAAALAATALGAKIIEKHFILDKSIGGPDASFSMEPAEFEKMINMIRQIEKSIGTVEYQLTEAKQNSRKYARSLFAVRDIKEGEKLSPENIKSIRPSDGLSPKYYYDILEKEAAVFIKRGTPLSFDQIKNGGK